MNELHDYELTTKILISMLLGIVVGLLINMNQLNLNEESFIHLYIVDGLFKLLGDLFVLLLKMLVVPLVVFSLISGVISIGNLKMLGRIGGKALLYYLFTTALAITTSLMLVILVSPGEGINKEGATFTAPTNVPTFSDTLTGIIPDNVVMAFAKGQMLPIIFFSVFFAVGYLSLKKRNLIFEEMVDVLNQIIMKMVHLVTYVAPIAVFALIAKPIAELGLAHLENLSGYILVLVVALLFHLFVSLMLLLKWTTGLSPHVFLSKIRETQLFAFSTASSNATMPSTLQTLTQRMGVKNSVASFTVPFGATINMDGTAIMQGIATVFIANAYHIDLGLSEYGLIIGMSVLASIGTAGVPSVGLVMLSMVFVKLDLPIESIGLLLGVDRLLDMIRTAVNVTGDAVVTCIIAKQEGELDEKVFYNFRAGLSDDELTEVDRKKILEEMIRSGKYEIEIDESGEVGTIKLKGE